VSKSAITYGMVTQWFLAKMQVMSVVLCCPICGEPLLPGQKVQWDHTHAEGLGGGHGTNHIRLVHYDPCHKKKTKRDVQALAKIDRITGVTGNGPKRNIPSRPFMKFKRKMRQAIKWRTNA
jgi:hypothetical protein